LYIFVAVSIADVWNVGAWLLMSIHITNIIIHYSLIVTRYFGSMLC